jgi:hypothetical protein
MSESAKANLTTPARLSRAKASVTDAPIMILAHGLSLLALALTQFD